MSGKKTHPKTRVSPSEISSLPNMFPISSDQCEFLVDQPYKYHKSNAHFLLHLDKFHGNLKRPGPPFCYRKKLPGNSGTSAGNWRILVTNLDKWQFTNLDFCKISWCPYLWRDNKNHLFTPLGLVFSCPRRSPWPVEQITILLIITHYYTYYTNIYHGTIGYDTIIIIKYSKYNLKINNWHVTHPKQSWSKVPCHVFFRSFGCSFATLLEHLTTSPAHGCFRSARNVASLRSCGGSSVWASSNAKRASDDPQSTECPDGPAVCTLHLPDRKMVCEMGERSGMVGHLWKDGESEIFWCDARVAIHNLWQQRLPHSSSRCLANGNGSDFPLAIVART